MARDIASRAHSMTQEQGKPLGEASAQPSAEMPFGGLKDSGYGSDGRPEALEAYLNARSVAVMNV
jgi:acyl-CoA reductase-like NAD-dependent aldehyde dehydrogenase